MYKGRRTPESVLNLNTADDVQIATQGYGVGNWHLVNGDRGKAKEIFDRVVAGRAWAAFGYIAAEADLKRGLWSGYDSRRIASFSVRSVTPANRRMNSSPGAGPA